LRPSANGKHVVFGSIPNPQQAVSPAIRRLTIVIEEGDNFSPSSGDSCVARCGYAPVYRVSQYHNTGPCSRRVGAISRAIINDDHL
jgi:hypothetical protein